MPRRTYADSVALLAERVEIVGDGLPEVTRVPRDDDPEPGPSIFRMNVEDVVLEDLTIPGLYVAYTHLERLSFKGSDLHLSAFNWSDVIECDFSGADLSRADLRACNFVRCDFSRAILAGADLRMSSFPRSTFSGADLHGALLRRPRTILGLFRVPAGEHPPALSPDQQHVVVWCDDAPEPGGG